MYNDSSTGQLTWIPWDYNEALKSGGAGTRATLSLSLDEVDESWPLIRYLLDQPAYYAQYVSYVEQTATEAFAPETMTAVYQTYVELIRPYVTTELPESTFDAAIDELVAHVNGRYDVVTEFVNAK